ncbi:MAG: rod shape-determining protein RodA [Gammaproteobacteria bacterium]|nr:rod shape-determining protein RodA [Gammaproteobacteria bacterium]
MLGLSLLALIGLVAIYSASQENASLIARQLARLGVGLIALMVIAQIPPRYLRLWSPWFYGLSLFLLIAVMFFGDVSKGAQRWLDLGVIRFQPSEPMKLALPMALAAYFHRRRLPPNFAQVLLAAIVIALPAALIARQPDLGTAILVAASGAIVLFLAGLNYRAIAGLCVLAMVTAPALWWALKDYQQERVLTFLNPERDPLHAGYHIIQSKIAIGSGGLFGKGWLNGSQAQLEFLPERYTDFVFAVLGEEFGLLGLLVIITLYFLVLGRTLYIAVNAQDTYARLVAGTIGITFFLYVFINIGMVSGLLPVVGVPLPLISYGGTSIVTLLAGFGILMSIHTHRKLLAR